MTALIAKNGRRGEENMRRQLPASSDEGERSVQRDGKSDGIGRDEIADIRRGVVREAQGGEVVICPPALLRYRRVSSFQSRRKEQELE